MAFNTAAFQHLVKQETGLYPCEMQAIHQAWHDFDNSHDPKVEDATLYLNYLRDHLAEGGQANPDETVRSIAEKWNTFCGPSNCAPALQRTSLFTTAFPKNFEPVLGFQGPPPTNFIPIVIPKLAPRLLPLMKPSLGHYGLAAAGGWYLGEKSLEILPLTPPEKTIIGWFQPEHDPMPSISKNLLDNPEPQGSGDGEESPLTGDAKEIFVRCYAVIYLSNLLLNIGSKNPNQITLGNMHEILALLSLTASKKSLDFICEDGIKNKFPQDACNAFHRKSDEWMLKLRQLANKNFWRPNDRLEDMNIETEMQDFVQQHFCNEH